MGAVPEERKRRLQQRKRGYAVATFTAFIIYGLIILSLLYTAAIFQE